MISVPQGLSIIAPRFIAGKPQNVFQVSQETKETAVPPGLENLSTFYPAINRGAIINRLFQGLFRHALR